MHDSITMAATATTLHGSHDPGVNCCDLLQTRPVQLRKTPQAVHGQPKRWLNTHEVPTRGSTKAEKDWRHSIDWMLAACTSDWCDWSYMRVMLMASKNT